MKIVGSFLASLGVIALMAAASAWAWLRLPDAPIAVHFDLGGRPDGWAPKLQALCALPAAAAGLSLMFAFMALFTSEKAGPRRSPSAYAAVWIGLMLVMAAVHGVIIARVLSPDLPVINLIGVILGALFMLIGNYAGKMRHNYVIGLRTPWTLADEQVWDKTHRLYGPLAALGGIGLFASSIALREPGQVRTALFACTLAPIAIATVYSIIISPRPKPQAAPDR
jgi:uncharacterized membrane protein